jgi:hypothetical protein
MIFRLASFALIFSLAGCSVEPVSQAMVDSYRLVRSGGASEHADRELNPNFKYMRVQVGNRVLFMALGYVDPTPDGPVEVWYSSDADVLRLRDGHVVGATLKTGINWSAVTFSHLPGWDVVGEQAVFERTRDVSPGYRYGINEKMLIRRIAAPEDTQLKIVPVSSLTWFEEIVQGGGEGRPARYAVRLDGVGTHQVVYAEQCLSGEFCFSWQNWPYSSKGTP